MSGPLGIPADLYARELDEEVRGLLRNGEQVTDVIARIIRMYEAEGKPRPQLADLLGYVRACKEGRDISNGTESRYTQWNELIYPPKKLAKPEDLLAEAERRKRILARIEAQEAKEKAEHDRLYGPKPPATPEELAQAGRASERLKEHLRKWGGILPW